MSNTHRISCLFVALSFVGCGLVQTSGSGLRLGVDSNSLQGSSSEGQQTTRAASPPPPATPAPAALTSTEPPSATAEQPAPAPSPAVEPAFVPVVGTLAGFTEEDALNLTRVEAAFRAAPTAMLRVVVGVRPENFLPTQLQTVHQGSQLATSGETRAHAHQVVVSGERQNGASHLRVDRLGQPIYEAVNSVALPGLVWRGTERDGEVVFIGVDGGRYRVGPRQVRPLPPGTTWPAANLAEGLLLDDLRTLAAAGQLPATAVQRIEAAEQDYIRCAERIFSSSDRAMEALGRRDMHPSTREARIEDVEGRAMERAARCRPLREAAAAVFAAIELRNADRLRLYNAVRAVHATPH